MRDIYYSEFVEVYEKLFSTTKRLEKEEILAEFLRKLASQKQFELIYLLKGKVYADYDIREFGISEHLSIKAISLAYGVSEKEVKEKFKKVGDIGEIVEFFVKKKRQSTLFSEKLVVNKVFENLRKISVVEGSGAVSKKIELIKELLARASAKEAKYIFRTLMQDLRVGVADGLIRDAIAKAFFPEEKTEMAEVVGNAYDLSGDFAEVFEKASQGKKSLEKIKIPLGKPINVMLAVKVDNIEEAFEVCGKPAAIEHKYDGFRVVISKKGNEIKLFTRRLEDVTRQFPDIVNAVKNCVVGNEFILDSEVVGYDKKTKKYKPFEAISQRIKRKYEIEKLINELPVEVNVFDILYYNGKNLMKNKFIERRKLLEKIVKEKEFVFRLARQIITDKEEEAINFFKEALKLGEEGIMVKKLDAPYQQGRRVGFMVKLKPTTNDLDLVIIGAEYGTGKRAGWLTSYILGCRSGDKFLEIGKVSSGLKEKEGALQDTISYKEMTDLLKPLIIEEKDNYVLVRAKVVVSVTYQNIQRSPAYNSGYALRFPRIIHYRPDKSLNDVATLEEIEKEVRKFAKKG